MNWINECFDFIGSILEKLLKAYHEIGVSWELKVLIINTSQTLKYFYLREVNLQIMNYLFFKCIRNLLGIDGKRKTKWLMLKISQQVYWVYM